MLKEKPPTATRGEIEEKSGPVKTRPVAMPLHQLLRHSHADHGV